MVLVRIGRIGSRVQEFAFPDHTIVMDAISRSGLRVEDNEMLFINEQQASAEHTAELVENGDMLIIKPMSKPKTFNEEAEFSQLAIAIWNIAHAPDIKTAEKITDRYMDVFRRLCR